MAGLFLMAMHAAAALGCWLSAAGTPFWQTSVKLVAVPASVGLIMMASSALPCPGPDGSGTAEGDGAGDVVSVSGDGEPDGAVGDGLEGVPDVVLGEGEGVGPPFGVQAANPATAIRTAARTSAGRPDCVRISSPPLFCPVYRRGTSSGPGRVAAIRSIMVACSWPTC